MYAHGQSKQDMLHLITITKQLKNKRASQNFANSGPNHDLRLLIIIDIIQPITGAN